MESGGDKQEEQASAKPRSKLAAVISGSASGAVVSLTLQPLDVIRTQLQAQAISSANGIASGTVRTAKEVWSNGGLRGFWRGSGPTVWRLSIGLGVQFFTLETVKDLLLSTHAARQSSDGQGDNTRQLSSLEAFFTGGLARGIAAAATVPFTIVKTRMEYAGPGDHAYSGTASALRRIVKGEGLAGLFRGVGPTVLTNAPFSALYYMFYSQLKRRVQQDDNPTPLVNFACGAVAAVAATLLTQPTDVIRTQMQLGIAKGAAPVSAVAAFRSVIAKRGPAILLTGAAPRVLKRSLQTALVWTLYEELQPRLAGKLKKRAEPSRDA